MEVAKPLPAECGPYISDKDLSTLQYADFLAIESAFVPEGVKVLGEEIH